MTWLPNGVEVFDVIVVGAVLDEKAKRAVDELLPYLKTAPE
ncbi:hypothetical protein CABS01_08331 [Colletotrichum abscissum]|nr:uncharacterized protein CABS01_08331 [Colletotrichum abscissum]KAK1507151.1 hypothetical protein CABS01_08331 [Colletotrichum abscissum]